jgi:hypothetical protein
MNGSGKPQGGTCKSGLSTLACCLGAGPSGVVVSAIGDDLCQGRGDLFLIRSETFLNRGDLLLIHGETFLDCVGLLLIRGETFLNCGDLLLIRGETFLNRGDLLLIRGETLLNRSDLLLIRSEALLNRGGPFLIRSEAFLDRGGLFQDVGARSVDSVSSFAGDHGNASCRRRLAWRRRDLRPCNPLKQRGTAGTGRSHAKSPPPGFRSTVFR